MKNIISRHSIPLLSFLSRASKALLGPLALLMIADNLSSEEMGFYYTFLSMSAMQQLLELGMGHTIKQYISHAYNDRNDWSLDSKKEIKQYYLFSFQWFSLIAILFLIAVGSFGFYFYSGYSGVISWRGPWIALTLTISLSLLVMPIQFILEGMQQQKTLFKAKLISGFASTFALCVSLHYGAELYSISVSILVSNLILYVLLLRPWLKVRYKLYDIEVHYQFKSTLIKVWIVLRDVSIVWGIGFFFWNSFNLLAFKVLTPSDAGKIGFVIALARAGYWIADSIISGQITVFANMIAKGNIKEAENKFKLYRIISIIILTTGYTLFLITQYFYTDALSIFNKTLDIKENIFVFIFFIILLATSSQNNFVRAFKVEPFVKMSIFSSSTIPIVFSISLILTKEYAFLFVSVIQLITLAWSNLIYKKQLLKFTQTPTINSLAS